LPRLAAAREAVVAHHVLDAAVQRAADDRLVLRLRSERARLLPVLGDRELLFRLARLAGVAGLRRLRLRALRRGLPLLDLSRRARARALVVLHALVDLVHEAARRGREAGEQQGDEQRARTD